MRTIQHILTALVGVLVFAQSAYSQTREDFTLGGLSAFVITPDTPAPGNPWIAYAPAVGNLPQWTGSEPEAWMFNQYFAAGIAVAGIYSGDRSGSPAQRAGYTNLYNELVGNRGYAAQFSFHTRSRGGLLGYNWTADNPEKVAAIGGIYPVTNLLSYPGQSTAASHYGITIQELNDNIELYNPIDRLAPLLNHGVKMFHIHGDSDTVVPLNENSQITKDRYDLLGGTMTLKVIVGGGHDGNNHWWTDQDLTDFMIAETLAAASTVGPPTLNTLTSVLPADDATDVTISSNLMATFSEAIALTGSGTINLKNLSDGADIPVALPADVTIAGRTLTIAPASDLVGGEAYAVEISSDAIEDFDDTPSPYSGLLSTDTPNWSFTADNTAPTVNSKAPMAGASDVPPSSDLMLTFEEDVQAGSGDITIHLASDDSVVETIVVTSGAVTITGAEVSINLGNLTTNTSYYVNIAAGAFEDLSGHPFAGILDDDTWNFATGDGQGPIDLINPSFEDNGSSATGWTAIGASGIYSSTVNGLPPTDGTLMSWKNDGDLYQDTGEVIVEGTTYTLTVDVGNISNFDNVPVTFRLYGSALGFETALGAAEGSAFANSAAWSLDQTVNFTATAAHAGQTLGIAFNVDGIQATWDNVRLEATAPPPTNTFVNWIDGFGLDPADKDLGDDIDGDNLANGVEAWFGTHPGQWTSGLADVSCTGLITTFTHPQNASLPDDLTGYYEWSPNLTDWYSSGDGPSGGPIVTFVPVTTGSTTIVTAAASTSEGTERIFLRAGVTQN